MFKKFFGKPVDSVEKAKPNVTIAQGELLKAEEVARQARMQKFRDMYDGKDDMEFNARVENEFRSLIKNSDIGISADEVDRLLSVSRDVSDSRPYINVDTMALYVGEDGKPTDQTLQKHVHFFDDGVVDIYTTGISTGMVEISAEEAKPLFAKYQPKKLLELYSLAVATANQKESNNKIKDFTL